MRSDVEERSSPSESENKSEDGGGGGEGVAEEEHLEGWFVEGDVWFSVEAVDEGLGLNLGRISKVDLFEM